MQGIRDAKRNNNIIPSVSSKFATMLKTRTVKKIKLAYYFEV